MLANSHKPKGNYYSRVFKSSSAESYKMKQINDKRSENAKSAKSFSDEEAEDEHWRYLAGKKKGGYKCKTGKGCKVYKPKPKLIAVDSDDFSLGHNNHHDD